MTKKNQLSEIHSLGKSYVIYKSKKGFEMYTDFSKKIILNNKNIINFLSKKYKKKSKNTDLLLLIIFSNFKILSIIFSLLSNT